MEKSCGNLSVEIVPGNTEISALLLPRERELSLAHAQMCSFLIMEQRYGPLSIDIFTGKHCDFSNYLAKRARAQSGACAEVQFPDYGTVLWSFGSRNGSRKTLRFQHLFCQERELSLEHAQMFSFLIMEHCCGPLEVVIVPSDNCDFSTYFAKSESSVWRMRRGAVS
jgi:hypothetical protein